VPGLVSRSHRGARSVLVPGDRRTRTQPRDLGSTELIICMCKCTFEGEHSFPVPISLQHGLHHALLFVEFLTFWKQNTLYCCAVNRLPRFDNYPITKDIFAIAPEALKRKWLQITTTPFALGCASEQFRPRRLLAWLWLSPVPRFPAACPAPCHHRVKQSC